MLKKQRQIKIANAVVTGNESGWNGYTALHLATYKGYKKIIKILLKYDKSLANAVVTGNKYDWLERPYPPPNRYMIKVMKQIVEVLLKVHDKFLANAVLAGNKSGWKGLYSPSHR